MMIKAAVAVKVIMMITDFESCFFLAASLYVPSLSGPTCINLQCSHYGDDIHI